MTPDTINGLFEGVGAILMTLNILRLHRDKLVRGVHWSPVLFWTAWGLWNLYYYSAIEQPLSWRGGACLVAANAVWLAQMIYYLRRERLSGRVIMDLSSRVRGHAR